MKEKTELYSAIAKAEIPAAAAGIIQNSFLAAKPEEKVLWICKCGNVNRTSFCPECGAPKSFENWICTCGTKNKGKFCTECGKKLVEY